MADIQRISEFGYNYQVKLITAIITDQPYFEQIHDILQIDFFENDAIKKIVHITKEYFVQYKSLPTIEVFAAKFKEIDDVILTTQAKEILKNAYQYVSAGDIQFIKDETLKFCINQNLKKAIYDSVELLERGDYNNIKVLIDNALKAGMNKDVGLDYKLTIESRYEEKNRNPIPTDWEVINELCNGGLGSGELGIIASSAGGGKSWILANIGAAALKKGYTVLHYTLELSDEYTAMRYDSILHGMPFQDLKFHVEEFKQKILELPGELIIKAYPSRNASIMTIEAHIEKMIQVGKKPDIIILDYADLLKPNIIHKNLRTDELIGNIFTDLRGLAGIYKLPIWTASQAGRDSENSNIIEGNKIAASYEKIMIGDFVFSLSRKTEDKVAGTARAYIIKNRFGPDGLTYPCKTNMSTGLITIYEANSINGRDAQHDMDTSSTFVKKHLANKYNELFKTT